MLAVLLLAVGLAPAARAGDPVALLQAVPPRESALAGGAVLLEWRLEDRAGAGRALDVVVVVVPGGAAHWRLLGADVAGPRAATLAGLACPGAVALTSGGFFVNVDGGGFAPLGLAVSDGLELSPFAPRRWGGVLVRRGPSSAIVPLAEFDAASSFDQALQSSPILIADGTNDMLADDGRLDNRVAVALGGQGAMIVMGAFRGGGAVSLHTLADLLLALEPAAGIRVDSALALDGGSSAQILLPDGDRTWGSSIAGYMPNALCLVAETP